MHIQHDPLAMGIGLLSRLVIALHLNPFTLELTLLTTPLPPCLAPNTFDSSLTQLRIDMVSSFTQVVLGNDLFLYLHPGWRGDLLGCECLQFFNRMVRGMVEEGTDDVEAFIVGYVSGRLEVTGFSISVLCMLHKPNARSIER